ncbi:MAG: hypothetical protein U0132_18610 [Gemmatimonadaceae bacterium]
MSSLSSPLISLAAVLGLAWYVFDHARDAARESPERRLKIMVRSAAGAVVGVVLIGLGVWAFNVMPKESPAPLIPLFAGVIVGGGLLVLSLARLLGAKMS